jgi:hypothetical protein
VVSWKAERSGVFAQVVQPQWPRVVDQQSEDAAATRQRSDLGGRGLIDTDGQKLGKQPNVVDDTQRAVLRINELDGGFDNAVQNRLQVESGADDEKSVEQSTVWTVRHALDR